MTTRIVVTPGICGMTAVIETSMINKRTVRFEVRSSCDRAVEISELSPVSLHDAIRPPVDSRIYVVASRKGVCASCPIPMAIIKGVEVEAKLALPKEVSIHFEKMEID